MDIRQLLSSAHEIMMRERIEHALIGGLALGFHGVVRFTNDVDFLVMGEERIRLKQVFASHGFNIFFESLEVLQLTGEGNIDFLFANRPLSQSMLASAIEVPGLKIKCVSAEDLIGLKIQAYVNDSKRAFQDKADIQGLMQNNDGLDWTKIKQYADVFSRWEDIVSIRALVEK